MKPEPRARVQALLAGLVLALTTGAGDTLAQSRTITVEAMRSEKRVALVIGNARYAPPADLRNPVNDAGDMAQALRALGFDVVFYADADLRQMQRAVREFTQKLAPGGVGLFYYAGHGVQVRGNNYLIPLGARISQEGEVEDEALDVNRVLKVMDDSRSRVSIVLLDACRDNPFARGWRSTTRGLAVLPAPSGTFVAYATGPGSVAADGAGRNGLFTGELLRAIREPGIPIEAAFKRVVASVKDRTQGRQVPWTLSSLDGDFFFALPRTAAVAPVPAPASPPPGPTVREEVRQALGSLALSSRLDGVEVLLDDQRVGEVRRGRALIVENLAVGTYRVTARKAGHKEWQREVRVAANQRAEVLIDIEPLRQEPPAALKTEDGAEMVLVPAGEFLMGSEDRDNEKPRHRVHLDAYYIDKVPVTNAHYERFVQATGRRAPLYGKYSEWNSSTQPVVGVSWYDAEAYCKWAGKRLPTEAEWEKGARGTDGRKYPWGDQWDPSRANAENKLGKTAPVGSYPGGASPYGALDMAGNVWQWVADWYAKDYYQGSPERNPTGPSSGTAKVLRGGSWQNSSGVLRSALRSDATPDYRDVTYGGIGFRCARGL